MSATGVSTATTGAGPAAGVERRAFGIYLQVARRSFQRFSRYRGATFAGVVTNTVFGFLLADIRLALFEHRSTVGAFTARDTVTFTFVSQGFLVTVGVLGTLDLGDRIRSGDVVSDLYRPVHFVTYFLAQEIGRSGFQAIFRGIPPFLFGALVFSLELPPTLLTAMAFVLSLVIAIVIGFAWRFIVELSGFWLLDTRGASGLAALVFSFFSGALVPLAFFPPALAHIADVLPFAATVELPCELFLGLHSGAGATASLLAHQLFWALALLGLAELAAHKALRRVASQGG